MFHNLVIEQRGIYAGSILVFLNSAVIGWIPWVMALVDSTSHDAWHLSLDLSGFFISNIDCCFLSVCVLLTCCDCNWTWPQRKIVVVIFLSPSTFRCVFYSRELAAHYMGSKQNSYQLLQWFISVSTAPNALFLPKHFWRDQWRLK